MKVFVSISLLLASLLVSIQIVAQDENPTPAPEPPDPPSECEKCGIVGDNAEFFQYIDPNADLILDELDLMLLQQAIFILGDPVIITSDMLRDIWKSKTSLDGNPGWDWRDAAIWNAFNDYMHLTKKPYLLPAQMLHCLTLVIIGLCPEEEIDNTR